MPVTGSLLGIQPAVSTYLILFFYVHGTVHLSNTSHINTNEMQLFSFYLVFITTYFGRGLRPSSGVLQTVVAATGVCHGCGVE